MPPLDDIVHTDRDRAESFGSIAEEYDKYRTSYPDALIADLVELTPARVLDIACGTGKVAVALQACGLGVLGVDPDPKMAEVARRHGILVEVGAFETWDDAGRRFGVITCGQGWHWVEPQAGAAKARKVLEPGGTLALFWSYPDFWPALRDRFDAVYREHAPSLMGVKASKNRVTPNETPHVDALHASGQFAGIETRTYRWTRTFTTEEWVHRSATFSDHLLLPEPQRTQLLDALGAVVDAEGGVIDLEFGTYTILATTPEDSMDVLTFPDVAEQLGIPVTRVHQLVRDGQLISVRPEDGPRGIPASFIQDGLVVKALPSVITQLRDAHYTDDEIVEWLLRDDESLPGSPIDALRANRGSEVKRRAQVAGY